MDYQEYWRQISDLERRKQSAKANGDWPTQKECIEQIQALQRRRDNSPYGTGSGSFYKVYN